MLTSKTTAPQQDQETTIEALNSLLNWEKTYKIPPFNRESFTNDTLCVCSCSCCCVVSLLYPLLSFYSLGFLKHKQNKQNFIPFFELILESALLELKASKDILSCFWTRCAGIFPYEHIFCFYGIHIGMAPNRKPHHHDLHAIANHHNHRAKQHSLSQASPEILIACLSPSSSH